MKFSRKITGGLEPTISFRLNTSLVIIFSVFVSAFSCSQKPEPYILNGVNIIDLDTGMVRINMSILISNGEIKDIYTKQSIQGNDGITIVDLKGKFIIPGLIDGHVHTTAGPPQILVENLKKTLKSGITTVRDMGGDGLLIKTWNKDLKGKIPNILSTSIFAGKTWIMGDKRSLASAHGSSPGTTSWLRYFRLETIKEDLRSAKDFGVSGIKIYADLNKTDVKLIVNEAHSIGLPVYAHATVYPASPLDIVEAGVNVISHVERMLPINDAMLPTTYFEANRQEKDYKLSGLQTAEMENYLHSIKSRNVAIDATLLVSKIRADRRNDESSETLTTVFALTKKAYELKIPVIAGTDHMINPNSDSANLHEELRLLVEEAGFSNRDALKAATSVPADFFGLKNKGKIGKGFDADMLILNENPLDDIRNTTNICMVVKSGIIYQ